MFSKWQFTKGYMTRGDKDNKILKTTLAHHPSFLKSETFQTDARATCKLAVGVSRPFPLCPASWGLLWCCPACRGLGNRKSWLA